MSNDTNPLVDAASPGLPWAEPDEPTERQVGQRRLAAALRALNDRTLRMSVSADQTAQAAIAIEAITESLSGLPRRLDVEGFSEPANAGDDRNHYEHSPFSGLGNPIAPPMALTVEPDRVIGRVTYGSAYEGPPGCVHGGHVAAAFDEVLGLAQNLGNNPGMTGTLSVRYIRPTPLHTELVFEGRLDRISGRKTFTVGSVSAGGEVCATAEGLFISITHEMFEGMMKQRSVRLNATS